ncbi:small GTP-binding protein domain [Edhazardia aedis USNM 41457]|uniref:Small GTP-binding protein domain n=1 Tax=Edhazardia aedis (strain USNM 41457) TaxID=1003232 RepID=J8ZRR7_EDHAE|nr:small GTP-binding protein domain [Edhazardia aedis USNM 41457]|eukprot:EJW02388.1 small GTP-binding protein domain [Edhazardia aedis USNM 41457]
MSTIPEKIKEIENEMARTQKNKATSYHIGTLKAKLAKLRRELVAPPSRSGPSGEGFDVSRTGNARIGFIGFPSVGKSTLMSALTGTFSEVADYEFTTLTTVPGVLNYNGAKLQILDLPGIIEGAKDGKGRGRQVLGVARTCGLLMIVLDVSKPITHKKIIERELDMYGIKLNKEPPNIRIRKLDKGGVSICGDTNIPSDVIKAVLSEYKVNNAEVIIKNPNYTVDDVIDVLEGNRKYVPCLYVLNKIDKISVEELDMIYRIPHAVPVCAHLKWNFDDLLSTAWEYLNLIRVYPKPRGANIDYEEPVILKKDKKRVEDFCNIIHRTIMSKFKYALVWGTSVKHNPQKVGKDHVLNDEDVVQIIKSV